MDDANLPRVIRPQEVKVEVEVDPAKLAEIITSLNAFLARPWTVHERREGRQNRDPEIIPYVPEVIRCFRQAGWAVRWDGALTFWLVT